jgi:hypothetical protein
LYLLSRGLGDVYKRQESYCSTFMGAALFMVENRS